jgi:GT2 family glycosyltransferase
MGEEGILANQIARAGGITMYQKELIVYHHDHSSIGKLPSKTLFDYSRISYKYYLENLTLIQ